jgi:hypothetical protein
VGVERRGQKYHRERLAEALREEIETIVEGELGDPRIGLVSVSSVMLAEDSRSARVLVTIEGTNKRLIGHCKVSSRRSGLSAGRWLSASTYAGPRSYSSSWTGRSSMKPGLMSY